MIENLFNYYNKNLTFYQVVIKNNRMINKIILYSLPILALFCSVVCYVFTREIIFSFITFFLFGCIIIFWGNYINASTIKRLYPDCAKSKFSWNSNNLIAMILEKMISYINESSIDESKLEIISSMAKEKRKGEKASYVIFISVLGLLLVPLWSAYIYLTLEILKFNAEMFNKTAFFYFFLILAFSVIAPMLENIYDNIFTKYYKWDRFCNLIDEVILNWKNTLPNKGLA